MIGNPKTVYGETPKILIARGDMLGDVILSTVVIKPLKQRFPNCQIYYLVRKEYIPLFEEIPEIDGCIEDPLEYCFSWKKSGQLLKLVRDLKPYNFDIFIGLWEKARYAFLAKLAGIKTRVGHKFGFINALLYNYPVQKDFRDFKMHQAEWNLLLLTPLDISAPYSAIYLKIPVKEALSLAKKYPFLITTYCCICIDTKLIQKRITDESYAQIIECILTNNIPVILIGTEGHLADVQKLKNYNNNSSLIIDITNQLTLKETMVVVANAKLYIGPDSGIAHMAAGFKRKSIIYFLNRAQHVLRWAPWQTESIVMQSSHSCSRVCDSLNCRKLDCRTGLNISEISEAIKLLLTSESNNSFPSHFKAGLNIGILGKDTSKIHEKLISRKFHCFELNQPYSLKSLVLFLIAHNINFIILYKQRLSLKHKIARSLASNYIHFFAEIIEIESLDDFWDFCKMT